MPAESDFTALMQRAEQACRAADWTTAEARCNEALARWPLAADAWHLRGLVRSQEGQLGPAREDFLRAVEIAPTQPVFLVNCGECCRRMDLLDEAVRWFRQAIGHAPNMAAAHFNLGNALRSQGDLRGAIEHLRQAVACEPRHARAHFNLGNALLELDDLYAAVSAYEMAIQHDLKHAAAVTNLATTLARLGRPREALERYRQAAALAPNDADALGNLASALASAGQHELALRQYQGALKLAPQQARWHAGAASALQELGDLDSARAGFAYALRLDPTLTSAHHGAAVVAREQERFDDATEHYRKLLELAPHDEVAIRNWSISYEVAGQMDEARAVLQPLLARPNRDEPLRLHAETLCPLVFESNDAIDAYRQHVERVLSEYPQGIRLDVPNLSVSSCHAPFAWPYLGRDERELKSRWADLFVRNFPQFEARRSSGRPHVGFVVTSGHESIFQRSMRGILERWPQQTFRTTIVCSGPRGEHTLRAGLQKVSAEYLPLASQFDQAVEQIRRAQFDLLYYWEVATDATNYFLPFCRLAPVQCTGWGWQVTTGIPSMDYYISSRFLEPDDGPSHYRERLALLDNLPTCYARPRVPAQPMPRETWGLRPDQHIYFCAQNLLKVHPDFDPRVGEILRRDPQGVAIFTSGRHAYRGDLLRRRFEKTLPDVLDRIRILPGLQEPEYLSLLARAEVSLDTVHYGGVNTTYDALAAGTPVVTLPGRWQRGRYTFAVYRHLELKDCVADSTEAYVDLAVGIACEPDRRRELNRRINEVSPELFDHPAPAKELAECFEKLLGGSGP